MNKTEMYKDNPVDPEVLEMWFFILLGVIFELVAVLTAYLAQLKRKNMAPGAKKETTADKKVASDNHIGFKPQVVTASNNDNDPIQGKRQIGFRASAVPQESKIENTKSLETLATTEPYNSSEINMDDVRKYVEHMYSSPKYIKAGESPGYNPIGQHTGLGVENARKIKAYLERLGIIKTVGTKTFVQIDLQACKAKLSQA